MIKKLNEFVSSKFEDVQLLDILKFFVGATTLDSFLAAYKASELKGHFQYEWFDTPSKLDEQQVHSYDNFCSKLKYINPLTEEQALKKLGLKANSLTGLVNYDYLKSIWEQENLSTFRNFLQ